jgi:PDZ domain-containing protein
VSDVVADINVSEGVEAYKPGGELIMLTVFYQDVNAYELVAAAVDPTVDVYRREQIRPPDQTDEEFRQQGLQQMDQSKENAIAVALSRVGVPSSGVAVIGLVDGAPAAQVLEVGDVITKIEGTDVSEPQDIGALIVDRAPGDVVDVTVRRGGVDQELKLELTADTANPGKVLVGIQARSAFLDPPVSIDSANIGGPSAGMMFTLGIIDLLTPGDLTRGHVVAGTGTISPDGSVGPIGGVRQKVVAAEAAGAEVIMVPQANYDTASTAPHTIEIISIGTIDDALTYLGSLPAV